MNEELKLCKEIIDKVKIYMDRKDYTGLRLYIDERKKYVEKYDESCRIMSKNSEAEYIDNLVKDLDVPNS